EIVVQSLISRMLQKQLMMRLMRFKVIFKPKAIVLKILSSAPLTISYPVLPAFVSAHHNQSKAV
ncbi:hypothetical protein, partial [Psychrobacter urativorans]|uniref:hypothetical protein n=1 Tax=Psychrobacter urativorans TaxID=45610 RepID=UPI003BB5B11F